MNVMKSLVITVGFGSVMSLSSLAFAETAQLGFETQPSYIPKNVISLTFDDGVDAVNTPRILDTLKAKGVKASFFINANNWSSENDFGVADLINRIINEGHEIANHTNHHQSLPSLSDDQIRSEITSVEDLVSRSTNGRVQHLTLLRAPFGEGFQNSTDQRVPNVVADYAVHIGWNFDSFDYNCEASEAGADCVYNGVMGPIDQGAYGVLLMHSVHAQTAAALPRVLDDLKARGFQFWSVEQVVKARYGKSSAELVGVAAPTPVEPTQPTQPTQPTTPTQPTQPTQPSSGACNGVAQWNENASYQVGDKVVLNNQLYTNQNENSFPGIEPNVSTWFWAAGAQCN